MLSKKQKVDKTLFKEVLAQKGINCHSPHLSLKIVKNKENRFSFVVSKKVTKSAVKRNLLRRRGYSIVGDIIESIKSPIIGIFFFKKGAENISFQELKEEILFLLKKLNVI
jgi:ribonuclease P protein component